MYLDLMKYQHMTHTAVQEKDLEMRILASEKCAATLLLLQQHKLCKIWDVLCSAVASYRNVISWNETIT